MVKNSNWQPGPDGGPEFFSGMIATYDDLCIDGNRTCSITQSGDMQGYDQYDLPIMVRGFHCVQWGYMIRRVDADSIVLRAEFYDYQNNLVEQQNAEIADRVDCNFNRVMMRFRVPYRAVYVRLSMHFNGKVTACTFYEPQAFYC